MQALAYWKAVTSDKAGFLERVIALLAESGVRPDDILSRLI